MNRSNSGFSKVGIGAAACVACCAVPIGVFLATTGALTIAGVAIFGLAGLVVLVPAALWWTRRRRHTTPVPDEPLRVSRRGSSQD